MLNVFYLLSFYAYIFTCFSSLNLSSNFILCLSFLILYICGHTYQFYVRLIVSSYYIIFILSSDELNSLVLRVLTSTAKNPHVAYTTINPPHFLHIQLVRKKSRSDSCLPSTKYFREAAFLSSTNSQPLQVLG